MFCTVCIIRVRGTSHPKTERSSFISLNSNSELLELMLTPIVRLELLWCDGVHVLNYNPKWPGSGDPVIYKMEIVLC